MHHAHEPEPVRSVIVLKKSLLGIVARWAVQQSPYAYPDNLTAVLDEVGRRFDAVAKDEIMRTRYINVPVQPRSVMRDLIRRLVIDIPEVQAWNERKNGNKAPLKFTSRYDLPGDPDDDFIDLDALATNIEMELRADLPEENKVTYLHEAR